MKTPRYLALGLFAVLPAFANADLVESSAQMVAKNTVKESTPKEFTHQCVVKSLKVSTLPQASQIPVVTVDLTECKLDNTPSNVYTTARAYVQEQTPFKEAILSHLTEAMKANKRVDLNVKNVTITDGMIVPTVTGLNITK